MTDGSVPSEIEAKLLVPQEADLRAIARLERVGRYRVQPRDVVKLHSIYLDTADLALANHGVALRVRRHAGRWEATAKWTGNVRGDGIGSSRAQLSRPRRGHPSHPTHLRSRTKQAHGDRCVLCLRPCARRSEANLSDRSVGRS